MGTELLIRDLQVRFDTPDGEIRAVNGVNLAVRGGECLAIVGESGSGKSQIFLAVLGVLAANGRVSGSARFGGIDLLECPRPMLDVVRGRCIGLVMQDPMTALTPHLTIGSQLTEVLRHHLGIGRAAARERARGLLTRVRIADADRRLHQYPHELSGGMRQRVMIALALAGEPALLIADEPTSALDVTVQAELLELLQDLKRTSHLGLVLITHDFGVVAELADRVAVMYAGRVVEEATAAELFRTPHHPYSFGLLRAMPRLDDPPDLDLPTIAGQAPLTGGEWRGCAFSPRCDWATEVCHAVAPILEPQTASARTVACHHPLARRVVP